jgi:two-component system nitrogen regulation response regulator NtrX
MKRGPLPEHLPGSPENFDLAHEGTLFLDEIGDMSLKTQAKILRIWKTRSLSGSGDQKQLRLMCV